MSTRSEEGGDSIKLDLHIHTFDDPKDKLDYSAHELLARARRLGFSVLAISLLLFLFRRIVQEKERPHWREETPQMPDEVTAPEAPAVPAT